MNISPAQIRYHENGQESRLGTQRNSSKWGVIPLNMKGLVLYHNSLLLARMNAHELTGSFNYKSVYNFSVMLLPAAAARNCCLASSGMQLYCNSTDFSDLVTTNILAIA